MRHLGFHLARPFEASLSAASVVDPYKMCNLDLSALSFAIRRLGSKTFLQNALHNPVPSSAAPDGKASIFETSEFFRQRGIRRDFPIRSPPIRRLQSDEGGRRSANRSDRHDRLMLERRATDRFAAIRLAASVLPACSPPTKPGCRARRRQWRHK